MLLANPYIRVHVRRIACVFAYIYIDSHRVLVETVTVIIIVYFGSRTLIQSHKPREYRVQIRVQTIKLFCRNCVALQNSIKSSAESPGSLF